MAKLHHITEDLYGFWCPGCDECHQIKVGIWTWNGSMDSPTFQPSILVQNGHFDSGHRSSECWCTFNAKHSEDPSKFQCRRCHSYVTEGRINFLPDSSHKLAGQTLDIPEWPI